MSSELFHEFTIIIPPNANSTSGPVQVPAWKCIACAWTAVEELIALTTAREYPTLLPDSFLPCFLLLPLRCLLLSLRFQLYYTCYQFAYCCYHHVTTRIKMCEDYVCFMIRLNPDSSIIMFPLTILPLLNRCN